MGLVLIIYLIGLSLSKIPVVQSWTADVLSQSLTNFLGTTVRIGDVSPGLFNRLIIDNVKVYDQNDSLMLNASRVAAKIRILPLLEKKVHIDNAQIIGADIKLYKTNTETPLNCQFLIDKFRKKENSQPKTDIQIGTLLARRSSVRYNQWNMPETPKHFNPNHLIVKNIDINVKVLYRLTDTLGIDLKRLCLTEESGLVVKNLSFMLQANKKNAKMSDFMFQTNNSNLEITQLKANYPYFPTEGDFKHWLQKTNITGKVEAQVVPADFKCFTSKLQYFSDPILFAGEYFTQGGDLFLPTFTLSDSRQNFQLEANATIQTFFSDPSISVNAIQLRTSKNLQQFITKNLCGEEAELSAYLTNIGNVLTEGNINYHNNTIDANLITTTQLGAITLQGELTNKDKIQAKISSAKFNLGQLFFTGKPNGLGNIAFTAEANGRLHGSDNKPELFFESLINSFVFHNHEYKNIAVNGNTKKNTYIANIDLADLNGTTRLKALADLQQNRKTIQCIGTISNFSPYLLNLTKAQEGVSYNAKWDINLDFVNSDQISGNIDVIDATIFSEQNGPTQIDSIRISSHYNQEGQQFLTFSSPIINAKAVGHFRWKDLAPAFLSITHQALPSIFPEPQHSISSENDITFAISAKDTTLLGSITGKDIRIPETAVIQGEMNNINQRIILNANIPQFYFAGNDLRHTELHLESYKNIIQTSLKTERIMKGKATELNVNAYANQNKLITRLDWDNHKSPAMSGSINLIGYFHRDLSNQQAIEGVINKSNIIINDTTWTLLPAHINFHDNVVDVENIKLECENRHISVSGRMSKESTDTLTADLNQIDLAYIFDMVNFHSVDFDGKATGLVYATSVFKKPVINGYVHIYDFLLNGAPMGDCDAYCNWGSKGKTITIDAHMRDLATKHQTSVSGTVTPGREEGSGLDLYIRADHTNIAFLDKWTKGIFSNLQGSVTGWTRLHGPFKIFAMEGDLVLNEASMHVISLGVDYHTAGDSVIMRPGNIWLKNITIHDSYSNNADSEHTAVFDGHLLYDRFTNMRYQFNATANNILGYDSHDFGDANFYGTVFADGQLKLSGQPGILNVDVNVSPREKSILVYKVASPETITEAGFITYVSHKDSASTSLQETPIMEKPKNDIHINFDLDVNPQATLKLIMDQRTGDHINIAGSGHILANFYNKGKFQMYGTYRVDNGTYKMSLQDVIRKDFTFQRDGSIIFGGNPMQATLNLKANYTVPNVSLDDLSATGLGLANTRVDCIMNIGGIAGAPEVTFDFDLPNANEDEKKMVRSMVSTEEERNMQVIYLLGIGRFYSYGAQYQQKSGGQSSMAINSFLSSTLTSQFNQILSNAVGSNNWTFGTNLRTGENGWDQLDVEGMLSGKMLNNRLLINGNFGYRESYYSTNNFIGDFDIRYILTRNGDFSLKAYNQTNDRYFVQSSLTTQGLGIQFKRDFNNWKEAFRRQKKTKTKTKTGKSTGTSTGTKTGTKTKAGTLTANQSTITYQL